MGAGRKLAGPKQQSSPEFKRNSVPSTIIMLVCLLLCMYALYCTATAMQR